MHQESGLELMKSDVEIKGNNGDYGALQSRIAELEARIFHLELEKRTNSQDGLLEPLTEQIELLKIKIVDFSPEWDYINGGNKLLICFTPAVQLLSNELKIVFGAIEQQAMCVQPGVLKCQGR